MWRLTRDLHLLESITFMSEANQKLVRTRIANPKTQVFSLALVFCRENLVRTPAVNPQNPDLEPQTLN